MPREARIKEHINGMWPPKDAPNLALGRRNLGKGDSHEGEEDRDEAHAVGGRGSNCGASSSHTVVEFSLFAALALLVICRPLHTRDQNAALPE